VLQNRKKRKEFENMENPASWTDAHRAIAKALEDHDESLKDQTRGPSEVGSIYLALEKKGFLCKDPLDMAIVREHVKKCPQYRWDKSRKKHERFKAADALLDGTLSEIHEWYIELEKLLGIPPEK